MGRLIIILILVGSIVGCSSSTKTPSDKEIPKNLEQAEKVIKESAEGISSSADKITEHTDNINNEVNEIKSQPPETPVSNVGENVNKIEENSKKIEDLANKIKLLSNDLNVARSQLKEASDKAESLQKEFNELNDKYQELIMEQTAARNKMLYGIVFMGIIGFGISAGLLVFGAGKLGVAGMVGSISVATAATIYQDEWENIGTIGGIVLLLIVVFAIYHFWKQRRATHQVVQTAEIMKERLDPEDKKELFGTETEPGKINMLQDKDTKNVVKKLRKVKIW